MVNFGRLPLLSWMKNVTKTKPCKETLKTRFLSPTVSLLQVVFNIACWSRDEFLFFYRLRFRGRHIENESKCRCYLPRAVPGWPPTLIMLMGKFENNSLISPNHLIIPQSSYFLQVTLLKKVMLDWLPFKIINNVSFLHRAAAARLNCF